MERFTCAARIRCSLCGKCGQTRVRIQCGSLKLYAFRTRNASGTGAPSRRKRAVEAPARTDVAQGERKRRAVGLRAGPVSGHPVPRAVGKTARHGGRDPRVHSRQRRGAEEKRAVKTNAARALDSLGIRFELREYEV